MRGHILISHTHWDHIQGIPFFEPLFAPGGEWDIYGPKGLGESLHDALAAQMQYAYFPVTLEQCAAKIRYHDLLEGSFAIGDIEVSARYLNHPALTLGYRLQADGATVVYACDHEPHSRMLAGGNGPIAGEDLRYAQFIADADLLIHDAQYTAQEYPHKIGWGHSPVEYVVKVGRFARAKRIALTHHDPLRDDDAIDSLMANIRQNSPGLDVFAAFEGQIVKLAASCATRPQQLLGDFQAETPIDPAALSQHCVLIVAADPGLQAVLGEAVRAEGIAVTSFSSIDEARTFLVKDCPALAIIEHDPPRIDGMEMCRVMLAQANHESHRPPVIMISRQEHQDAWATAEATDWLFKPFTAAFARTKVSAWLLRSACQSIRGGVAARAERRFGVSMPMPLAEPNEPLPASSDKSALLWMYGREIAAFETPAFSKKLGEIIARATQAPHRTGRQPLSAP
jgi:phosphoribosyl 1,2-cyclic phosphodiesterase/CheY-like chemotaxis protein